MTNTTNNTAPAIDLDKLEAAEGDQFGHLNEDGVFYDIGTVDADQYAAGDECFNEAVLSFIAAFDPSTASALIDLARRATSAPQAAPATMAGSVDCPECGFGREHDPSCPRATATTTASASLAGHEAGAESGVELAETRMDTGFQAGAGPGTYTASASADYDCYNCGGKESAHNAGCPAIRAPAPSHDDKASASGEVV